MDEMLTYYTEKLARKERRLAAIRRSEELPGELTLAEEITKKELIAEIVLLEEFIDDLKHYGKEEMKK